VALTPGARLGRFTIVRQLGAGAMGEVYLGEDPQIGRPVALKTVRLAAEAIWGSADVLRDRLLREARAAGRLVHPNVVTLFEAGEAEGTFFLAFELVDGEDLETRLRRGPPLTTGEVIRIGRDAALGLDAAHRRGIIHRDIKPANLMLTREGGLKITDFGIAKLSDQATRLTHTGSVVGTPQYLSPEQIRGEALDGRSDLFSLGALLYEALARRLAFDADTLPSLMYQVLTATPPDLAGLRPDLPPRLCATVMRLLAKDPSQRFATAGELAAELETIAGNLPATPASAPPRSVSAQTAPPGFTAAVTATAPVSMGDAAEREAPRPRRVPWLWLGAGIVGFILIAVVAGVLVLFLKTRPPAPSTTASPPTSPLPVFPSPAAASPPPTVAPSVPFVAPRAAPTVEATAAVERRAVGGSLVLHVLPPAAEASAVLKVDGLVRGPAAGSVHFLTPGEHRIEVTARGFAAYVLDVRADAGAPVTELRVELARGGAAP